MIKLLILKHILISKSKHPIIKLLINKKISKKTKVKNK